MVNALRVGGGSLEVRTSTRGFHANNGAVDVCLARAQATSDSQCIAFGVGIDGASDGTVYIEKEIKYQDVKELSDNHTWVGLRCHKGRGGCESSCADMNESGSRESHCDNWEESKT
jgi:hypothetical protein